MTTFFVGGEEYEEDGCSASKAAVSEEEYNYYNHL